MEQNEDTGITLIKQIAGNFPRHPRQVNRIFEADSEIVSIVGLEGAYLVLKTDGIHEEIHQGLYKDPYLIGWMALTVTISDLAATAAMPTGLLVSLQLPKHLNEDWIEELQRGIQEACVAYDTFIFGGDTNFTDQISITTTGIGTANKPLTRKGLQGGQLLYSTSFLGAGNAFAYSVFFDRSIKIPYKPVARLKESRIIKEFATACIDTSDGLFPALSVLAELNGTGIHFHQTMQSILSPQTKTAYEKAGIPAWMFLAGPHGEYELLFSIQDSQQHDFEAACLLDGWQPLLLGEVTRDKQVSFISESDAITCRPAEIANIYDEADGNIDEYLQKLFQKHRQWCSNKTVSL